MTSMKRLRVAALVDLPRSPLSGGHVKGWEQLAQAALSIDVPLDLTIYFSGEAKTEELGQYVHLRQLPAVFSTQRLKFLPYVPDNTDLAPFHPALARELKNYDVIHTTDGFFAFAQTAERVSRHEKIPLVTSFHTDTPAYARVFTRMTIEKRFGNGPLAHFLLDKLHLPEWQEKKKIDRLKKHLKACREAFTTREKDTALAASILGAEHVHLLRHRVNTQMFNPAKKDRAGVEERYNIPPEHVLILFVGRLDVGKNIYVLIDAVEEMIAQGKAVHLITAGIGPAEKDLHERLGSHVTVAGFVDPQELAILYASADLLAMPSEVEIGSRTACEALASGLPLLVSDKNGVPESFDFSPAMRVVSGGSEAWIQALRDLVGSTNQRTYMAKEALACTKTHIASWEDVLAKDLFAVWQKAAEDHNPKYPHGIL